MQLITISFFPQNARVSCVIWPLTCHMTALFIDIADDAIICESKVIIY